MASPGVSPSRNSSMPPSPSQLTPRSKVKAMLAALDDDSDGGVTAAPRPTDVLPGSENAIRSLVGNELGTSLTPKINRSTTGGAEDGNEDEDEDVVFKPRGRIAAAMLAARNESEFDRSQGRKHSRGQAKKLPVAEEEMSSGSHEEAYASGSGDQEVSPVVSRKRKMRGARNSTPRSELLQSTTTGRPENTFSSPPVQKSPVLPSHSSESDDDLPTNPTANVRFMALVQKKREERLMKEAAIQRQKAERAALLKTNAKNHLDILEDDAIEYSDEEGGKKLTQQARPTRKASKRALEEMGRETQRMSRNMQLAHEARTKKKITKTSLFAKFNYKPAGFVEEKEHQPTSSSPAPQTDAEVNDTPPTSPISYPGDMEKSMNLSEVVVRDTFGSGGSGVSREDIPNMVDAYARDKASSLLWHSSKSNEGKGIASEELHLLEGKHKEIKNSNSTMNLRLFRVRPKVNFENISTGNNSDSDLEIEPMQIQEKKKKDSIFDRVPAKQAKESHSLHALRMLAHITSPGKQTRGNNRTPSMTASELQTSLQQRARQQALREREERLQVLRNSGVIVQTAEERERDMADMEDLIAKARREGEEIMNREREAAKKQRKAKGEADQLGDSSDDEDWQEEKDSLALQMSKSGSDSDGDDEADGSDVEDLEEGEDEDEISVDEEADNISTSNPAGALIDNEASESDTDEEDAEDSDQETAMNIIDDGDEITDAIHEDNIMLPAANNRRRAKYLVVSDDEDDQAAVPPTPNFQSKGSPMAMQNTQSPKPPTSVLRSATKTFIPGLTVAGPAGLGLTQIFAGTMDEDNTQPFRDSPNNARQAANGLDIAQDSLAFLRNLPQPNLPDFEATMDDDSQDIVRDSQTQASQIPESPLAGAVSQGIHLNFSQSQVHRFDSMLQDPSATQLSDFPEPTQDAGFQEMSPIKGRFVDLAPSTMDTVLLERTPTVDRVTESPVAKKKGKLLRRTEAMMLQDEGLPETTSQISTYNEDELEITENIFDVMRKASKRTELALDEFDKKKSGAKDMVHEQAEESEDEYAGLGGASDDESGGEQDAFVKEMIDDEVRKDVDESKLAAFYADKERANDEKQVEKLFKDITNGMLRRKRGADYDLSDSDDGGEARRRMKRKEFAKMRKALLEDERIGKIAENPKKMAFLRAIEDRGEDDEIGFLDDLGDGEDASDYQSPTQADASQSETVEANGQESITMGPPKRKLGNDSESEKRLPPHLRRTQPAKRPSNLSEIRESLSSLIEEPNAILVSNDASGSESELENENNASEIGPSDKENENSDPFALRRKANISVVDRISLKRATSNNTSTTARLAFAAPSSAPGFKTPALLRRSTTNSSISSASSSSISGTERMAGGFGDDTKVPKKAGKNSGVNYFARENERKMKLQETESKRKEKRWKGAEGRRKAVGGLFGIGTFE